MAKEVRVSWLEKEQFVGIDETRHAVVISSQNEENGTGMNPFSLLPVSLGGCTSHDVHYIGRGRGLQEKAVRDASQLSEEIYGSVSGTLRDVVEITYDYEIAEA